VKEQDSAGLLAARVVREQVGRISAGFRHQLGVHLEDGVTPGGVAYQYAADQLLVQTNAIQQARGVLGPQPRTSPATSVIGGVSLLQFGPARPYLPHLAVRDAVDRINQAVGSRVAAPNYVLTVAPGGPCPATEPQEVYFDTEPFPGVRMEDGSDGHGVRIYIADTGLLADATSHPWLKGVRGQPDPLEPEPGEKIKPYAGHGTYVAGVARCMARKADVFVSNVFKIAGSALESDFVQDLDAALDHGVDIFNLSVTTPAEEDLRLLGFEAWLTRLAEYPDVVCVVAAGNDHSGHKFWPAAYPGMVSVGALAADWRSRASFTNHGDWVEVYAPGRDLVNAYATGTYECVDAPYTGQLRKFYGLAKWSGTSFSTPLVAGLIAARKSRTGLSARKAADSLLAQAKTIPGVGKILLPYDNGFDI
jgi:subtilisin family serine protease